VNILNKKILIYGKISIQSPRMLIDVSWAVNENTTSWKNEFPIKFINPRTWKDHECRTTSIENFFLHTGTHVDFPSHFLKNGNSSESFSLEKLTGKSKLLNLTHCKESISSKDLESFDKEINEGDIVLLKTLNSFFKENDAWTQNFVYLDASGAQYLVDKKIKSVGIDYIGIERSDLQKNHETHCSLLSNNIIIVEGLRFGHVEVDSFEEFQFICLPLKLEGVDGSPARAILIK
jgi:arylformamidase